MYFPGRKAAYFLPADVEQVALGFVRVIGSLGAGADGSPIAVAGVQEVGSKFTPFVPMQPPTAAAPILSWTPDVLVLDPVVQSDRARTGDAHAEELT